MPDWAFLASIGIVLIIIGFFLVAFGMMRCAGEKGKDREIQKESMKGGGVILIGPIPVVFGTDKRFALIAMILAIILMLLAIVLQIVFLK